MKYFINSPYTTNSLRRDYYSLCKKLHPDRGGDTEKFKEMMNEYSSIKISIDKTNYYTEYSSSKQKQQERKNSEFNSKSKPYSKEKSGFNKKSKTSEEARYSILYELLARQIYINESLKEFLIKISKLPFKDAEIVYNKFYEEIKIIIAFDKVIDTLEILKFSGYDEISYTIEYEHGGMYKSCATIDAIIEKISNIIKK
jgi:hypothetical protein